MTERNKALVKLGVVAAILIGNYASEIIRKRRVANKQIHVFEAAGLGVAPFEFVGSHRKKHNCQFCGRHIVECCVIQDAEGKRAIVGNICIEKSGDKGLREASSASIKNLRRKAKREKK